MIRCPNCQAENAPGSHVCYNCGTPLVGATRAYPGGVPPYSPYPPVVPPPPSPRPRRNLLPWILGIAGAGIAVVALVACGLVAYVASRRGGEPTATAVVRGPTPRASATAVSRTPVVTPVGSPLPGTVLILDTFTDNRNQWPVDGTREALDPGRYRIKAGSNETQRAWPETARNAGDLVVEAEMQKLSGPASGGYGVFLRETLDLGYYIFYVTDEGRYTLTRYVRAASNQGLNAYDYMTRGPAKVNPGAKNTLRLTARGKTLRMEVNGTVLGEVEETKTFSTFGRYGVWVDSDVHMGVTRFQANELK